MAQEHVNELRDILNKELDEDTKAEIESVGLNLDRDEDIEKIASAMTIFDAHERGEKLSEEQLEFVSGGNIFKKIWHGIKHAVKRVGVAPKSFFGIMVNHLLLGFQLDSYTLLSSDLGVFFKCEWAF